MKLSFFKQSEQLMLVSLEGSLEVSEMPALNDRLEASVGEGYTDFVVDLSRVIFMGSASLTTLIRLLRQAQGLGGAVKLVAPENNTVSRVLYITKFDHVFTIYKTADEALASF